MNKKVQRIKDRYSYLRISYFPRTLSDSKAFLFLPSVPCAKYMIVLIFNLMIDLALNQSLAV